MMGQKKQAKQKGSPRGPFAVVDAGSSKLTALIVARAGSRLQLLGQAMHASDGLKQGEIVDLDKFSSALGKTVQAAEKKAGLQVSKLHIVTAAGKPATQICRYGIELADNQIGVRDLRRLRARQNDTGLPEQRSLIQRQRLQYLVDDQHHINNPLGMHGSRLASDITLLSIERTTAANLQRAVLEAHLEAGQIHNAACMAGRACLSREARELGALVLDFGGGTTGSALFMDDRIVYADTVRMGGQHITRDLARILNLGLADAERIKAMDGSVTAVSENHLAAAPFPARGDNFVLNTVGLPTEQITLPNGETAERSLLAAIIRPRVEEILDLIKQRLEAAQMTAAIGQRIVLTGGGAQLTGLADFVSHYWGRTATLGLPQGLDGLDSHPSHLPFAASVGMAIHLAEGESEPEEETGPLAAPKNPFGRLGQWLREHI